MLIAQHSMYNAAANTLAETFVDDFFLSYNLPGIGDKYTRMKSQNLPEYCAQHNEH